VLGCVGAEYFTEHQLIKLLTNYFTIVFSHNFFTYK
jgi:hypothetical protein